MTALSKSILVVEDDVDIRESLVGFLRDEGYETSACSNGLAALEHLRGGHPTDIILLDLMMPVMDGWQFRVRQKQDPRLATIPVVVLSADTTAKAVAMDADAYIHKPVDSASLLGGIERTLLAAERRTLHATLAETERLASLGTLAAGVAHEINNPLAYVIANLGYIDRAFRDGARAQDEVPLHEALSEARQGCERIRTIVRDLQLFSRSPEVVSEGPVDVRQVLDSSANIVMSEIRARATLTKDYEDVPAIGANAVRLGQVFLNLVLNAAQAIPEGAPRENEIRLATRVEEGAIVVRVSDTGGGVAPEIRDRIFDPFFTTKPIGVGTGLGLSISHRIVSAMGGELAIEARPGRGTTFRVRLPIVAPKPRVEPGRPAVEAAPRRARLLVVDDEPMIGTMIVRVVGATHDVESTTSPDAALARVAAGERFDLILCDLMMPGRSGADVHAAIERIAPEQARRMVFLTGGALNAGAADFLSRHGGTVVNKPFSVDELCSQIDGALSKLER